MKTLFHILAATGALSHFSLMAAIQPVPFTVPAQMPDVAELLPASAVRLDGFLGGRVANNARNRLAKVDLEPLLAGYRTKPGSHPWIGEHIGKWMHAATLAWASTGGEPELRNRLDYAAAELIKTQEPNGYLGTYVPEQRFGLYQGADWDVWSHKYCLMGLLTYYQYTGTEPALAACRKMGDLLIDTFGPGKKSIIAAGTHVGMAATSVLEPIVLLYRFTGDQRYLEFARYLVQAWDEPNGPKILQTLLTARNVQKTANSKAYEMLSNLVGLLELARVTGNQEYLRAGINAWEDIVARRLYLTGSASQGEHFREDHHLPNQESAHVAETCVTTTWIQFNSQLLRLTGQTRFADQLERTFYNHLAAAQRPDGAEWCYFTALEGRKPYGPGINCCVSSGPRGMAMVPQHACLKTRVGDHDALAINLFESARTTLPLGGAEVTLEQVSEFPRAGRMTLTLHLSESATFALQFRQPDWAVPLTVTHQGKSAEGIFTDTGWMTLPPRSWQDGDRLTISFNLSAKLVSGTHGNTGKAALTWGPIVLAYDQSLNPDLPHPRLLGLVAEPGQPPFRLSQPAELQFLAQVRSGRLPGPGPARFVPFAQAGSQGATYRIWLHAPGVEFARNESLLADGEEARSRTGNVEGSINDGDTGTFVVTFNGKPADQDWFAVTLDKPIVIARVLFAHGRTFHDGGWFDTSAGKPRLQIQRTRGGTWETVGELESYPVTTAQSSADLKDGQSFTQRLQQPVEAVALRVVGKPASGDNPRQAFSSCAELQGYAD